MVKGGSRNRMISKIIYWAEIVDWFRILQENELTSSDYKVLFYLFEKMSLQGNEVFIRQQKIAEDMNINKGNVSKCIKSLSEKQLIAKAGFGIMINPHLFYVGSKYIPEKDKVRQLFDELLTLKGIQPHFQN